MTNSALPSSTSSLDQCPKRSQILPITDVNAGQYAFRCRSSRWLRVGFVCFMVFALFGPIVENRAVAAKPKPTTKPLTKPAKSSKPGAASKSAAKSKAKITLGVLRKTRLERDGIRAKAAAKAAQLRVTKANRAQAAKALQALNSNVRLSSISLDKAQRKSTAARKELVATEARLRSLELRLRSLRSSQIDEALRQYGEPSGSSVDAVLQAESGSEASRRGAYVEIARRNTADVVDALAATGEDVRIERGRAARARKRADAVKTAVSTRLADFKQASEDQQKIAGLLEVKLERDLEESASLAELDKATSDRLAKQNEELSKQLFIAGAGQRGSGSFTINGPNGRTTIIEVSGVGGGSDTHGIRVAPSIRSNLARMLAAAKADGIYLTGGGYRSPANQIQLRAAHCGGGVFNIYNKKSSLCRPPTARPGNSQHERGLAIDFTQGGRIFNRSSPGYIWLRANAGRFGFKNLPSEAWHWSTTGR